MEKLVRLTIERLVYHLNLCNRCIREQRHALGRETTKYTEIHYLLTMSDIMPSIKLTDFVYNGRRMYASLRLDTTDPAIQAIIKSIPGFDDNCMYEFDLKVDPPKPEVIQLLTLVRSYNQRIMNDKPGLVVDTTKAAALMKEYHILQETIELADYVTNIDVRPHEHNGIEYKIFAALTFRGGYHHAYPVFDDTCLSISKTDAVYRFETRK